MSEPKLTPPEPGRMTTPDYGFDKAENVPGERLPWSRVSELLVASRNYWICTTRPDGRPHSAPVWGVWLDGTLYFSTGARSRKGRNLAADPRCVVHLEGEEAVILEGTAEKVTDLSLLRRFVDAYNPKYQWNFSAEGLQSGGVYALRPRVAFSFREELAETATRWRFRDG